MSLFEDRCSFPREAVTACGVRLLTMWRVKAGATYRREFERSRHDSREKIHQAGQNLVVVRTDRGEGVVEVRGQRHRLVKGSLFLFDFPALERYHTVGAKWDFWWVELVATEPLHLPLCRVLEAATTSREQVRCEKIFEGLHSERIERRYLAAAHWQSLFFEWWASVDVATPRFSHEDHAVQRMLETVKRRPELTWKLEDMAKTVGMSPSTFRAACHLVLGKTPTQVRTDLKLSHAYEYLRRGDRNVGEVAAALGYCDAFHFSKEFKKQYGFSPSEVQNHRR